MSTPATIAGNAPAGTLLAAMAVAAPGTAIVVANARLDLNETLTSKLVATLEAADAATASPVPAGGFTSVAYELHKLLPPAPTLAGPCPDLCAVSVDAVAALGSLPAMAGTAADAAPQRARMA